MCALSTLALPIALALLACDAALAPEEALARETILVMSPSGPIPADDLNHRKVRGVRVEGVDPGSTADQAGIQEGDIIVAVDRKPVSTPAALIQAIRDHDVDTPILLKIRRGDSMLFVTLNAKSEINDAFPIPTAPSRFPPSDTCA